MWMHGFVIVAAHRLRRNVITVVIHVDAPVGQAIGVKEQLAMYLERFGNAKVVLVTEKEPEQLGLEGFE